jgi:GAF domain-containing protein/nitrogen-specific signal transduction histidine kinase
MATTQVGTIAELQRTIAGLRQELSERDATLALRNSENDKRIELQAATIDVLKEMSAFPGDPSPVFQLIVKRATAFCEADGAGLVLLVKDMLHLQTYYNHPDPAAYEASFPQPVSTATMFGRAILACDAVQMPDSQSDTEYGLRSALEGEPRSMVGVPLLRAGAPIGAIVIVRRKLGEFSATQVELLWTFAEQAVIAITSAETHRQLHEALERQTATAEVLQVINTSPANLTPVFDAILEKAMRLCQAVFGQLSTFDGERFHTAAIRGVPAAFADYRARNPADYGPGTGPGRLIAGEPVVHIADLKAEEPYARGEPNRRAIVDLGGARSSLMVRLDRDGALLGFIQIYRKEVRPFSEKEISLLQNFAAQAVIAMENARLISEQREALEQQTATAEVLGVINANPGDLTPVFEAMLDKAHSLCGAVVGSLMTFDGEFSCAVASHGLSERHMALVRKPFRPTPGQQAMIRGARLAQTLDLKAIEPDPGDAITRSIIETTDVRTGLMIPMRKDGAYLGCISAYRLEVGLFSEREIALLENFAAQAVIAMENARLMTEQREALEQQTATAEVLQVINANPGDLTPVFDTMLEKAMRLCGVAFGMMTTFDGERFHPIVWRGLPAALSAYFAEGGGPSASSGMHGRLVAGSALAHVVGMKDEEAYRSGYAARRALVDLGGAQTGLAIALRKDDALLGTFMLYRQEIRPFTDKQIALLQNFAAQAVIAMENARLITEQREALEQQTATAEVLQVINASPGDLAPVFGTILEKALQLCGAAFGVFAVLDGEVFKTVAVRGVKPELAVVLREPARPRPGLALYRVVQGEDVVQIADIADDEAYRMGIPARRHMVDLGGARTQLLVALRKDDALLGVFLIFRQEVRPFADKQIALLRNFAAQAVIAMENARLITEQREALEQQTAIADVLRAINATPGELAPVFDVIGERAIKLCDAAAGALMLPDGDRFRAVALGGVPEAYAEFCRNSPAYGRPYPGSLPARMLAGDDVVHIKDITDVDEYAPANTPAARALAELGGGRTLLGVALRKDDKLFGMITIFRQAVRPFSDRQVVLLRSFADQAVIAMENARLLEEVRQRQEELRITFENMGDGVAMFDETQHLVAWNRKFQDILDVPDDIIARRQTFSEYVHYLAERGEYDLGGDPEDHVRGLIEQAGQSRTYERARPDGRVIDIRHNPVPGGGFVLIYADITERKRSEAEIRAARDAAEEASRTIEAAYRELKTAQANLIQAEKMASLGQLTAGIAHEIKNPLNFVNNFAALSVDLLSELKETAAPGFATLSEEQRAEVEDVSAMLTSNLEKITEHGKRADGIVKAMLEHSRGSSGERRIVDLNELIDEALNLAYHGARAQDQTFNITLDRDFGEGIAPIEVNPQDMTRVFLNIFSNGFYATTRQGRDGGDSAFMPTLKVTTRDAGDAVEIGVRDNGTGIPADIRDKLFQPFFTTKPTGEGTGLGLSITYDIVTQQHGGSIAVDSKVGDYSEFTIRLPRNP